MQVKIEQERLLQEFDMIDPVLIAGMDQAQRRPIADAFWKEGDPTNQMGEQAESFGQFANRICAFIATAASSSNEMNASPDRTTAYLSLKWGGGGGEGGYYPW